jgi:tetratricopeptide (TPR) repeat protein
MATALAILSLPTPAAADACQPTASDLYGSAHRAFEDKQYDESVALLRRAYACDPDPIYLANIARAYEEAHRPRDAVDAWREYLTVVRDDRERRSTEGRISALTKVLDDLDRIDRERRTAEEAVKRQAEQQRGTLTPAPPRAKRSVSAAAWITLGAGALGLASGAVLGAVALSEHSNASNNPMATQAYSTNNDAMKLGAAANWAYGIGGAVAGAGLVWISIDLLTPRATSHQLALRPTGTGVLLTGAFQ